MTARQKPTHEGHVDSRVTMASDGLDLAPADYATLLGRIAESDQHGADAYGRGGIVDALEAHIAARFAKPAAAIMPTGTMANLLAVQALAGKDRKVIVQQESHLYNDSGDCAQTLAGLNLVPLGPGATFDATALEHVIDRIGTGKVAAPIGVISIESPVRRLDGELFDFETMHEVCGFARERGIRLHLDGARLYAGAVYSRHALTDFTQLFDTVYVSLYKNFNTLCGAILAGPADLIEQLRQWRRRNGGGLAQWWPVAAVALHFENGFHDRLSAAADIAESFYAALDADENFCIEAVTNGSSVRYLSRTGEDAAALVQFRERLLRQNIVLPACDETRLRFALKTNESWLNTDAKTLVEAFQSAATAG